MNPAKTLLGSLIGTVGSYAERAQADKLAVLISHWEPDSEERVYNLYKVLLLKQDGTYSPAWSWETTELPAIPGALLEGHRVEVHGLRVCRWFNDC